MTVDLIEDLMQNEMQRLLGLFRGIGDPSEAPMTNEVILDFIKDILARKKILSSEGASTVRLGEKRRQAGILKLKP